MRWMQSRLEKLHGRMEEDEELERRSRLGQRRAVRVMACLGWCCRGCVAVWEEGPATGPPEPDEESRTMTAAALGVVPLG